MRLAPAKCGWSQFVLGVVLGTADKIHEGVGEGKSAVGQPAAKDDKALARSTKPKSGTAKKKLTGAAPGRKVRPKATAKSAGKSKSIVEAEANEDDSTPISRKELLEKALRTIAGDLNAERDERPTNTIGSLVQLLKLDRAFREDEEQPHEIRVVWEEKRDETIDDSAENSRDASNET